MPHAANPGTVQPNLMHMIADLQSFEKFLEKIRWDKLITQSEMKSLVAQRIVNLHSHYRGKYEDVLINILKHNFQSSSLTLEDVQFYVQVVFKEESEI